MSRPEEVGNQLENGDKYNHIEEVDEHGEAGGDGIEDSGDGARVHFDDSAANPENCCQSKNRQELQDEKKLLQERLALQKILRSSTQVVLCAHLGWMIRKQWTRNRSKIMN